MLMDNVKSRLLNLIIEDFSNNESDISIANVAQINRELHLIMSHSKQAIFFITSIEEEFDIEIDDEEVCLDNFLSFENLILLIQRYLDA